MAVPESVMQAYGWSDQPVVPLTGGLINETFLVGDLSAPVAILQKLHPVFEPAVNHDIDAITTRLAEVGVATPRLIKTRDGELFVDRWRALTFVPGHSFDRVQSPSQAQSAAALVGRFHAALDGWTHDFAFVRSGAHDTAAHLDALKSRLEASSDEPHDGVLELANRILETANELPALPKTPRRICHGDLKISNVRFDSSGDDASATCLLDLDTIGHQTLAYELGDAMRSWCNRATEDQPPSLDDDVFVAAMRGYQTTMPDSVSSVELESIALGTEVVCLELAARFCADVFDDSYFGWDASKHPSRRAHNDARARAMLGLATLVGSRRSHLVSLAQTGV